MRRGTRRKVEPSDKVMPTGKPREAVKKVTRPGDDAPVVDVFDDDDVDATDGSAASESGSTVTKTDKSDTSGKSDPSDKSDRPAGGIVERRDRRHKRKGGGSKRVTEKTNPAASTRYTPPSARYEDMPSPIWVPILMFTLFGAGMLTIFLNYVGLLPGETSNWYLLLGLGFILGGIITATQYR